MIIIEFNEEIQSFHYNPMINGKPRAIPNTNGYKTLFTCNDYYEADLFCDFFFNQYLKRGYKIGYNEAVYTLENLYKFFNREIQLIADKKIKADILLSFE